MVQTRAATKRIESGKVSSKKGAPSKQTATKPSSRPIKKPRGGGRKPSKEQPQRTPKLNLDVLFLIAAYLHPGDLLNLARTCRSLRELLMDTYSTFVWKMARSSTGMPDCPPDLTEPQYANLFFGSACHACGKYAPTILWKIYRRYCSGCKVERLVPLYACHGVISSRGILATEEVTMQGKTMTCVDKEQADSFMSEYNHSSDKNLLLCEKRRRLVAIRKHANACMDWQKNDLKIRREERETCIFERLVQHGYEPEINYFSRDEIKLSRASFFKTSRLITDQGWTQMWPKWLETMNRFRNKRLDITVYRPRQSQLLSEYADYVEHPAIDGPVFDFLPHATDLVRLPPFRDVLKAPEGTDMDDKPFKFAFAQLPMLVDEWRREFDAQLAELVEIPSHLSLRFSPDDRVAGSSKIMHMDSSQSATDKLHLACAVFTTNCPDAVFLYPEVLSAMRHRGGAVENDPRRAAFIENRFHIKHLDDAPYIVHACGLDPNVATVEDMDRRKARLMCLCCQPANIMGWRDAMIHARILRPTKRAPFSIERRWEFVGCGYTRATRPIERRYRWSHLRCLMCRPHVGDCLAHYDVSSHFHRCHGLNFVQPNVNYAGLEMSAEPRD